MSLSRFDASLSTNTGDRATRDLGISPDQTHTGRPTTASRSDHMIKLLSNQAPELLDALNPEAFSLSRMPRIDPDAPLRWSGSPALAACGVLDHLCSVPDDGRRLSGCVRVSRTSARIAG